MLTGDPSDGMDVRSLSVDFTSRVIGPGLRSSGPESPSPRQVPGRLTLYLHTHCRPGYFCHTSTRGCLGVFYETQLRWVTNRYLHEFIAYDQLSNNALGEASRSEIHTQVHTYLDNIQMTRSNGRTVLTAFSRENPGHKCLIIDDRGLVPPSG